MPPGRAAKVVLDRVFGSGPDNNFGVLVEPVPLAADCTHSVGEAAQLGAEPADVDVDGALVGHLFGVAPQPLEEFVAPHGAGAVLNEVVQELELLEGQIERLAVQVDFTACQGDQDAGRARLLCLRRTRGLSAEPGVPAGATATAA